MIIISVSQTRLYTGQMITRYELVNGSQNRPGWYGGKEGRIGCLPLDENVPVFFPKGKKVMHMPLINGCYIWLEENSGIMTRYLIASSRRDAYAERESREIAEAVGNLLEDDARMREVAEANSLETGNFSHGDRAFLRDVGLRSQAESMPGDHVSEFLKGYNKKAADSYMRMMMRREMEGEDG